MRFGEIDIPGALLNAQRDGKLVVFAGAGVSMGPPSNYPSFEGLAEEIAEGSQVVRKEHEPLDRFLGRLHRNGQGVDVHGLAKTKPDPLDSSHPTSDTLA